LLTVMAPALALTAAFAVWPSPGISAEQTDSPQAAKTKKAQSKLVKDISPVYPPAAKAAGIEGTVTLQVVIEKNGHVSSVKAVAGPPILRQSAVDAVTEWVFEPTILNGEAVVVKTDIEINFRLDKPADKPASS